MSGILITAVVTKNGSGFVPIDTLIVNLCAFTEDKNLLEDMLLYYLDIFYNYFFTGHGSYEENHLKIEINLLFLFLATIPSFPLVHETFLVYTKNIH